MTEHSAVLPFDRLTTQPELVEGHRRVDTGLRQAQPERCRHWAEQYIGQRWASGAEGPDAWDCGTFVRHVQRKHYGREIPHVFADASNIHEVVRALAGLDLGDWDEMPTPRDGDGVILAHARYGSHVGVWIDVDGGGVLHCQNGAGVIFTPANRLALSGWPRCKYYRPAS